MNLLLVSPSISNMYKDIISQLNMMGFSVDYIEDKGDNDDPDYIRNKKRIRYREKNRSVYLNKNERRWELLISKSPYDKIYDYLLVIDGMSVSPYLFQELKRRNPKIWCANYLFDSTTSLYRFQIYFKYYNLVASFDRQDCKKYHLKFLPIYWQDNNNKPNTQYKFFGVGGFSQERYKLYKYISDYANKHNYNSFIKLYFPLAKHHWVFYLKTFVKKILGDKKSITIDQYNSVFITHKSISSDDYRILMNHSEIIIDSVNFEQDGMTARFMWALGLGKRIITTNKHFSEYSCYDPNQILIINKDSINLEELESFMSKKYSFKQSVQQEIEYWRIDNWLTTILKLHDEK